MSHELGRVEAVDGAVLGYFEYSGTCSVALPAVWATSEEVYANWRSETLRRCTCLPTGTEECVLILDSGYNLCWHAKWCPECKVITKGLDPYRYQEEDEDTDTIFGGFPGRKIP